MSYIQLRITHSLIDATADMVRYHLEKFIKEKYDSTKYALCTEKIDKFGKETHEHIHCNFYTDNMDIKKNTLQQQLKKKFTKLGYELKGTKHYSVRILGDPDDEDRWWRYCWKEDTKVKHFGFDEETVENYKILAPDEREQQIKKNNEHIDKYLDKSSFKGKMYEKFKEQGIKDHRSFTIEYIKYCQKNHKVPSFTKIDDYFLDYKISSGLITPDEWYDEKYAQFNH